MLRDYFERVYIISLPRRTDRRCRISAELATVGDTIGRDSVQFFDAISPDDADGFRSQAERGCFLSHYTLAKRSLEDRLASVLILEDDAIFTPEMRVCGHKMLESLLGQRWHIAFLGYHNVCTDRFPIGEWVPESPHRIGMHCYALQREVMPSLVDYMEATASRPAGHPEGGRMSTDPVFQMFRARNPWSMSMMASPCLALQGSSASDIVPRWFDRVPLLRTAAGIARSARLGNSHHGR